MTKLVVLAITHQHAPFDLLERVALDDAGAQRLAVSLWQRAAEEVVVLSTCNRTELYLAGPSIDSSTALATLAMQTGAPLDALRAAVVIASGATTSRHLFAVAAGLESRVVGEGQILGQVRGALARATKVGTVGRHLRSLFSAAAAAGRRSRRTEPAAPPSLAAVALDAAGLAAGSTTLVVGAGEMAGAAVAELRRRSQAHVVTARRTDRAAHLAGRTGSVRPFAELTDALVDLDAVVFATSARSALVDRAAVEAVMRRRTRPLTIIDLALPRNVDPDSAAVDGVHLVDLASLSSDRGELHRRRAAQAVDEEHVRYQMWLAGRVAATDIRRLRDAVTQRCVDAVGDERLGLRVAAKLLHAPTIALKELHRAGDADGANQLLTAFGVDGHPAAQLQEAS